MNPAPLDSPSLLDKVEHCHLLHSGGEGDVYRVSIAQKDFVLKWYRPGCTFDDSVLEAVAKSRDEGHFRLREHGVRRAGENATPYLVYDYIEGVSSDKIQGMPLPVALYALRRLASSLGDLRKCGVSHGDLSPSNVVFTVVESNSSMDLQPVAIDFGIVGPGALAYAAPERFQGAAPSEKSDMFGLGLLLYRWIVGVDLIVARDFEEFASRSSTLTGLGIAETLYVKDYFSAQEISALEPLWNGMLAADPENRFEDFDELDENLEIALNKVSGGEILLSNMIQGFVSQLEIRKAGEKVPTGEKCDLPYAVLKPSGKISPRKIFAFAVCVLILLVVALWLVFGTKSTDIDATGAMLLEQSRSMDLDSARESPEGKDPAENVPVDEILENLPVPPSGNQSLE